MNDYQKFFFDVNGYIILPNVIGDAKIEVLKAQIEDLQQRRPDELPEGVAYHEQSTPNGYNDRSVGFNELVYISEEFQSLIDRPLVMDVLAAIMPAKIRLDQSYGFILKQQSGEIFMAGRQRRPAAMTCATAESFRRTPSWRCSSMITRRPAASRASPAAATATSASRLKSIKSGNHEMVRRCTIRRSNRATP